MISQRTVISKQRFSNFPWSRDGRSGLELHTEKPRASLYLNPILRVVVCIEIKESLNIDGNKIHQYQQNKQ
jgi:hypothetical protein